MATLTAECLGELCVGYAPQRGNGRATRRRQQQGEGFPLADLCAVVPAFSAVTIGSCGEGASGAAMRVRLFGPVRKGHGMDSVGAEIAAVKTMDADPGRIAKIGAPHYARP
ncbi:hypothetical protein [uncultured Bilophila sp.]|uniref:hypothetical protein n=1 Tax=uncultured Bilophila sp. TaxID=529385 RepID=UPI00280AEB95|nr:hypothetical protein [uncultured Bilophila sp.]